MPLYEYACEACGRVTEALQRVGDPALTECPHCGGPLRKLVSAPAFQFKGSGWYVTDYARKSGSGGGRRATGGEETGPAATDQPAPAAPESGAKPAEPAQQPAKPTSGE